MHVKLFVGNVPWDITDIDLQEIFSPHGQVKSARIITDRETGRSRGFGFVELETDSIEAVISATNGQEVGGRPLRVNEAEDRNDGGQRRPYRGVNRDRDRGGGQRGRY